MNRSILPVHLGAVGIAFVASLGLAACTNQAPPPSGSNSSAIAGRTGGGSDPDFNPAGSGGGYGYGYAEVHRVQRDRHHVMDLASGEKTVSMSWRFAAGVAPASDLSVQVADRNLIQISAVGDAPFAHVGLEAVPLTANETYTIVLSAANDTVTAKIVASNGEVVVSNHVASGAAVADVVLPGTFYRASIVSALK